MSLDRTAGSSPQQNINNQNPLEERWNALTIDQQKQVDTNFKSRNIVLKILTFGRNSEQKDLNRSVRVFIQNEFPSHIRKLEGQVESGQNLSAAHKELSFLGSCILTASLMPNQNQKQLAELGAKIIDLQKKIPSDVKESAWYKQPPKISQEQQRAQDYQKVKEGISFPARPREETKPLANRPLPVPPRPVPVPPRPVPPARMASIRPFPSNPLQPLPEKAAPPPAQAPKNFFEGRPEVTTLRTNIAQAAVKTEQADTASLSKADRNFLKIFTEIHETESSLSLVTEGDGKPIKGEGTDNIGNLVHWQKLAQNPEHANDPLVKEINLKLKDASEAIKVLDKKFASAADPNLDAETKLELLLDTYSSPEFKGYSKLLQDMSVLDLRVQERVKEGSSYGDYSRNLIVYTQRLPRHVMFLQSLKKENSALKDHSKFNEVLKSVDDQTKLMNAKIGYRQLENARNTQAKDLPILENTIMENMINNGYYRKEEANFNETEKNGVLKQFNAKGRISYEQKVKDSEKMAKKYSSMSVKSLPNGMVVDQDVNKLKQLKTELASVKEFLDYLPPEKRKSTSGANSLYRKADTALNLIDKTLAKIDHLENQAKLAPKRTS